MSLASRRVDLSEPPVAVEDAMESILPVKLRIPLPVLLAVSVAGDGLTPFSTAVKIRLEGETERTGCGEAAAEA